MTFPTDPRSVSRDELIRRRYRRRLTRSEWVRVLVAMDSPIYYGYEPYCGVLQLAPLAVYRRENATEAAQRFLSFDERARRAIAARKRP